jgi:hypothetical protein
VLVTGNNPFMTATDATDRAADGCFTVAVNHGGPTSFFMSVSLAGGAGQVDFTSITTTWAPSSLLPASAPDSTPVGGAEAGF